MLTFPDANVLIAAATGQGNHAPQALAIMRDPARTFASSPFVRLELVPKAVFHKRIAEAAFAALHHADTSGGFLEWLEERVNPAELETALRQYLPDFSSRALTDPQQRIILNQRLAALGPLVLYELHQRITRNSTRLTPAEIVEKTWGTIKGIDQALLRQIIEDEDYLCAVALPTS